MSRLLIKGSGMNGHLYEVLLENGDRVEGVRRVMIDIEVGKKVKAVLEIIDFDLDLDLPDQEIKKISPKKKEIEG